jgi:hypothetical protein
MQCCVLRIRIPNIHFSAAAGILRDKCGTVGEIQRGVERRGDWLLLAACVIIPERFVRATSILRANLSSMMPLETATSESVMKILNRRAQSVVRSTRRSHFQAEPTKKQV